MLCNGCGVGRLSSEYLPYNPLVNCDCPDFFLNCIQCYFSYVKQNKQCPGCRSMVSENEERLIGKFNRELTEPKNLKVLSACHSSDNADYAINISMLDGNTKTLNCTSSMHLLDFKETVKETFGLTNNFVLYHEEKELQVSNFDNLFVKNNKKNNKKKQNLTLEECGIQNRDSIQH